MVIKLVPKFSRKQIEDMVRKKMQAIEKAIIARLRRVGETFIENARSVDSYKDQTGNLRSSIGYVILKDGQQIDSAFNGSTSTGRGKAKEVLDDAIAKFPQGYALIVVAGMEYAAAVESRGRDVLTGSSKIAEQQLKLALAEVTRKIGV